MRKFTMDLINLLTTNLAKKRKRRCISRRNKFFSMSFVSFVIQFIMTTLKHILSSAKKKGERSLNYTVPILKIILFSVYTESNW